MDTPRNVTLVYRGDRVAPQPFVQANVTHGGNSGNLPNAFYLELKKANGSLVTFLNGETKLRFTAPSMSSYRLAGQFDAAANSMSTTAVYPVTVIVGAEYSGGTAETWTSSTIIVVNEASSPIARGWTVAGIQHLYVQGDGTVLITDGTGTATYFTGGPSTFTSPTGDFSRLTFNGSYYFRAYPDSSTIWFNTSGYMVSAVDRWGTTTRVRYSSNKLYRILDPTDTTKVIQIAYGSYGLASITDPGSRTTSVSVDASGRLTSMTDPDNVSTGFGYDGSLRLSTVTDRAGHTTTLGYDAQAGTLASVAAPSIQVVNTDGSLTDAAPTTQYAAWQKVGAPYSSTSGTPSSSVLASSVQGSIADPGSHTTSFTVNSFGQPLIATDALGGVTTTTYGAGLPLTMAYPTGGTDTVSYNASGLPQYSHPAGGPRTWFHYSSWATLADSAYGDAPTLRQYISSPGKVDSLKVGGTRLTRYWYTSDGRLSTEKDSAGTFVAGYQYQGVNLNHSQASVPGGRTTAFYQDNIGRDTAVAAPMVKMRITQYDALNRVVATYDSAGATPTRIWFGATTLDSVEDAKGQFYRLAYNALGWLTHRTDPTGAMDSSQYDRDGELRLWTNRRGQQMQLGYDALHRPTSKTGANTSAATWSYSSNDRVVTGGSPADTETTYLGVSGQPDSTLTTMAGQTFWRRYRYTVAQLLDSVNVTGGGITFTARKYLYGAVGALSTVALNGDTTSLTRDYRGLETMLAFRGDSAVSYENNSTSGLSQSYTGGTYSGGVVLSVAYDSLVRLSRQVLGNQRLGTQYYYDAVGRVAAESTIYYHGTPPGSCSGNPWPTMEDYGNTCIDDAGWYASFGTTYSYDAVGNRTDSTGTYGTGDRMTSFAGCTYETDADGDVTSRSCSGQSVTFYWSAESRLDSVSVGGLRVAFKYDAAGRLVRKDTSGVTQRYFLWDSANLLAELGGAATTKIAEYSYYGVDRLHALILGSTPYHAHQDVMGNTIALTDASLERSYGYNAWGSLISGSDGLPFGGADRARWKGALWLGPELDVYYMRSRWYEPKTGRFLSEDPLGLAAGINPYVYAADDPVNRADPSGLWPCWLNPFCVAGMYGKVGKFIYTAVSCWIVNCTVPPNDPTSPNALDEPHNTETLYVPPEDEKTKNGGTSVKYGAQGSNGNTTLFGTGLSNSDWATSEWSEWTSSDQSYFEGNNGMALSIGIGGSLRLALAFLFVLTM